MRISRERLSREAADTGFRPEVLEKIIHMLHLLDVMQRHPALGRCLALKGGTALNLFYFDLPRLSVDIDLHFIGTADRTEMLAERESIDRALQAVCQREELATTRMPSEHAGGKWRLRYASALGGGGNLEVDLNYLYRVPLWPVTLMDSASVGSYSAKRVAVLDLHELAAGKLAALFARHASRDLFDAYQLLSSGKLDPARLRLGFVLYGAMNRKDWRTISLDDLAYDMRDLKNQLLPMLRGKVRESLPHDWAEQMVAFCRERLAGLLAFSDAEAEFLDRLLGQGELKPELITTNPILIARILSHPLLLWKAQNVRQHCGKQDRG